MKRRKTILMGLLFLLVGSSFYADQPASLIGAWEIESLRITFNSINNTDSNSILTVTAAEWEQKMQSRNIRTFFLANGQYHSVHKNLQDKVVYDPAGYWQIIKDSLFIRDTLPKAITYQYRVRVSGDEAEFWGIEDFDQDGKTDDYYYSKQRRIR